ncbi:MAG: peptidase [Bacillales bacterium]|jgi:murein DD-endopeptidase MepM/ murein hydrolase activator NlpD|nr:peptidase [Bacillales bacterium]
MLKKVAIVFFLTYITNFSTTFAIIDEKEVLEKRVALYKKTSTVTNVPWEYIAAIDQYERTARRLRQDIPKKVTGITGVYVPDNLWYGLYKGDKKVATPALINNFGGIGMDGNGDGIADSDNDEDALYTVTKLISSYGLSKDQLKIGIWEWYFRSRTVDIIMANVKLLENVHYTKLQEHAFPVAIRSNHSVKNSYGARRSFGGLRMHEGIDIFAGYGVPVKATSYGVIVLKGWNRLGGWRIGIQDFNNNYHYFAHLGSFSKDIKQGDIVKPGQVIGYVGSSGYGPPGTSGKFPPHLHYGIYKDLGRGEWSFNPTPHIYQWKREELRRK